jgi:serine/threonine-protein kinase HipA
MSSEELKCHIEIFIGDQWELAATFQPGESGISRGTEGNCWFEYDSDYALAHLDDPAFALAPDYPVNFELHILDHWPSFLLDLLPGGHARRRWLNILDLDDKPASDIQLLLNGGGNPPGNLRIREAAKDPIPGKRGFTMEEVGESEASFIEYAEAAGALVSGASSVQGEAPKFLITKDRNGLFHPDGALPDREVTEYWLVKYPRGRTERDADILETEAAYYEIAAHFGLFVGRPLKYLSVGRGALFIPRFDRRVSSDHKTERLGMWTLSAAVGSYRFGERRYHEEFCEIIAKHSSSVNSDLIEYFKRDILNLALGNTDNHGRNIAFLREPDGRIALAPVFDFAPMFFDPEGIARATRWSFETAGQSPNLEQALKSLEGIAGTSLPIDIGDILIKVKKLPELLIKGASSKEVLERCIAKIETVQEGLKGML